MYGSYESLEEAKLACINDTECIAVQDSFCDGIGDFHLCKKGIKSPNIKSCIRVKNAVNFHRKC